MLALIPLLPFAGFLVNALLGKRLPKSISGGVACAAMIAAFGVSLSTVMRMVGTPGHAIEQTVYTWIASGDLHIGASFYVDPLASVMILVITGIGSLIHIYSTAYMHDESDSEFARYFSYLNLFAAFMLVLVLGSNFPMLFVGWEGVGLCSYLLIGFWYRKQSAIDAGKKAFVVNRIGDFAFILGTLLVFSQFGTLDFQDVASKVAALPVETGWGVLSVATLLLFIGATGKSAQIPLFTWLPDAMEGPTPVSALIHAATMVTAGVYTAPARARHQWARGDRRQRHRGRVGTQPDAVALRRRWPGPDATAAGPVASRRFSRGPASRATSPTTASRSTRIEIVARAAAGDADGRSVGASLRGADGARARVRHQRARPRCHRARRRHVEHRSSLHERSRVLARPGVLGHGDDAVREGGAR